MTALALACLCPFAAVGLIVGALLGWAARLGAVVGTAMP